MAIDKKQRDADFTALTEKVRRINPLMADWMDKEARNLPGGTYYGGGRLMSAFVWSKSPFLMVDWENVSYSLDDGSI